MFYKDLYTGETVELLGKTSDGSPILRRGDKVWVSCYNLLEKIPQQVKVEFDKGSNSYTCEAEELPVDTVVFHKKARVFGVVTQVFTKSFASKSAKDFLLVVETRSL